MDRMMGVDARNTMKVSTLEWFKIWMLQKSVIRNANGTTQNCLSVSSDKGERCMAFKLHRIVSTTDTNDNWNINNNMGRLKYSIANLFNTNMVDDDNIYIPTSTLIMIGYYH